MSTRLGLLLGLACSYAFAQLQLLDERTWTVCSKDVVIDLGDVGTSGISADFRLTNAGSAAVNLDSLKIAGVGYALKVATATPVTILSNAYMDFSVQLTPTSTGHYGADLYINGTKSYSFTANVVPGGGGSSTPPGGMPRFRIVVDPPNLTSGMQAKLTLKFDRVAPAAGNGLLTLTPNTKGDPAIMFISPAVKSLPFTIAQGEDLARFLGVAEIDFQTGTTTGSIDLTATLGAETEHTTFLLAPQAIAIDSIRTSQPAPGQFLVAVSGFDNTRTASQVRYTFLDRNGGILGGGAMTADVSSVFGDYFKHPEMGGMFVLRAVFPVSGDLSQIDSISVNLTNSAGVTSASVKMAQ